MKDQTMSNKALSRPAALHMPLQAAPINRTTAPAALAGTPGIEADGIWDFVKKGIEWGVPKLWNALT